MANQMQPELNSRRLPLLPMQVELALERGAAILTSNQRSARTLRRGFAALKLQQAQTVWSPPAILSWNAWTSSQWQRLLLDGVEDRLLLSAAQEHAVWVSIIGSDKSLKTLQRSDSLADLAQRAWLSLARDCGLHRLRDCTGSVDAETFGRWAIEFDRRSKRERWLSISQLDQAIADRILSGQLTVSEPELALIGFDGLTGAQDALCDALRSAQILCQHLSLSVPPEQHTLVPEKHTLVQAEQHKLVIAEDTEEEAYAAAWNALSVLEANPQARIAVILPDVAARRSEMERAFRHVLSPELEGISAASTPPPFEFSLGRPLDRLPMISTALTLLRWVSQPLPFPQFSRLLLSPYFAGGAASLNARAEMDEHLRRKPNLLMPEVSVEWLLARFEASPRLKASPHLAPLRQKLTSALRIAREAGLQRPHKSLSGAGNHTGSSDKTHSEWAALIQDLLTAFGWPTSSSPAPGIPASGTPASGDPDPRPLDSTEFQLLRKWQQLLDQLSTLDFADLAPSGPRPSSSSPSGPRVPYQSALDSLQRLAAQTLFAPESADAPVQIMGVLESAGSVFDAILFLGATDAGWPAAESTAPFLPWQLQRCLRMPGTDPAAASHRAITVHHRILTAAPTVFFSYAASDGKQEFRPSPLLAEFAAIPVIAAQNCIRKDWRVVQHPVELEEFDGDGTIAPTHDRLLRGGAQLLKLQSLCPFRAFAENRLGSSEPETIEPGLDARQRGSLVHTALEKFWTEVKTQENLAQMSMPNRLTLLDSIATSAVAHQHQATSAWDRAYLDLQRRWLIRLLDRWMDVELARPPFAVISREDDRSHSEIGPLRLHLRPDRVDAVDGGLLFLDYKTGQCSPANWLGERPEEPQLPLYATLCDPALLAGLAFARVSASEMNLSGYAIAPGILKPARFKANGEPCKASEVSEDLAAQVAEWKRVLASLAEEFHQGLAAVTPKDYPKTCERCGQRPFCRVSESRLALEANAFDDDPSETFAYGSDTPDSGEETDA